MAAGVIFAAAWSLSSVCLLLSRWAAMPALVRMRSLGSGSAIAQK